VYGVYDPLAEPDPVVVRLKMLCTPGVLRIFARELDVGPVAREAEEYHLSGPMAPAAVLATVPLTNADWLWPATTGDSGFALSASEGSDLLRDKPLLGVEGRAA